MTRNNRPRSTTQIARKLGVSRTTVIKAVNAQSSKVITLQSSEVFTLQAPNLPSFQPPSTPHQPSQEAATNAAVHGLDLEQVGQRRRTALDSAQPHSRHHLDRRCSDRHRHRPGRRTTRQAFRRHHHVADRAPHDVPGPHSLQTQRPALTSALVNFHVVDLVRFRLPLTRNPHVRQRTALVASALLDLALMDQEARCARRAAVRVLARWRSLRAGPRYWDATVNP